MDEEMTALVTVWPAGYSAHDLLLVRGKRLAWVMALPKYYAIGMDGQVPVMYNDTPSHFEFVPADDLSRPPFDPRSQEDKK